jgi:hypothetical protein
MQHPIQKRLTDDFLAFVWVIWRHLNLPAPTPVQLDIARYLQHGPIRRVIEAFRGVGKSWLTAAYVLWRLYRNPEERILVISANEERAVQFTTFVRRLIEEIPILGHLKPKEGQRDSVLSFDVGPASAHQTPSVRAAGINGQITGGRAHVVIFDDVEVPKNSLTQTMRDRLSELVKEAAALIIPERHDIVYLGTPQCEDSLYNRLPERGYEVRVWPSRLPKKIEQYGGRLAPMILKMLGKKPALTPVEPTRFHEEILVNAELEYGRAGFALQFMLDTALSDIDKYPLKLRDLMVMSLGYEMAPARLTWGSGPSTTVEVGSVGMAGDRWYEPMFWTRDDFRPWTGVAMAVDPSGRGGDETTYAVAGILSGFIYILEVRGMKGGSTPENLQRIADAAKRWKVNHIIVEENYGDGMFTQLLTPYVSATHPCAMEEVKHSSQKEQRICDVLEPLALQHRLVVNRQVIEDDLSNYNDYPAEKAHRYSLWHQFTRITRERNALAKDDRVDVLAMVCAYWVEHMAKDVRKLEQEQKDAVQKKALDRFMKAARAKGPGRKGFLTSITGRVVR